MTLPAAHEDLVHTPRNERTWRESYYWDACDPAGEFMLYATFGKRPARGRSGFLIAIWDTAADLLLAGQDVDTFEAHDDNHSIAGLRLECIEPFRRWRLSYSGSLVRCPRSGVHRHAEPRRIDLADRTLSAISFKLDFDCIGDPRVYEAAEGWRATFDGHHEQSTRASGWLEVDGVRRELNDLPGIRDHSWGTRDWHGVTQSRWVAAALEGNADLSLMQQTRLDGTVALDGAIYREGGAITGVASYSETVGYEESQKPPEAKAITMTVEDADGERLELVGEVRAMLPIRFASKESPGLVTWNDRAFVAFDAGGRKGFGTVEFQRLIDDPEAT
jgi:hypothetical protein